MAKEHVHGVFESIADGYDAANDRISLGMHRLWKRALCDAALKPCTNAKRAGLVLDVCCGTGDITAMLAEKNPDVLICGLDFSAHMLDVARERTKDLPNVMLIEGNAMRLPFDDGTFDSAVISFGLRNTPDYKQVVSEMVRVTRPGGVVACLDASVPESAVIQPFYQFYYKNIMTLFAAALLIARSMTGSTRAPRNSCAKTSSCAFLRTAVSSRRVRVHSCSAPLPCTRVSIRCLACR